MTDFNERIEKAMKGAWMALSETLVDAYGLRVQTLRAFGEFSDALKEPENSTPDCYDQPVKEFKDRHAKEPHVPHPNGHVWIRTTGDPPCRCWATLPAKIPLQAEEYYMTRGEAFQPGALARWISPLDSNEYMQGYVIGVDSIWDGVFLMGKLRKYEELTLVKPAPEAMP